MKQNFLGYLLTIIILGKNTLNLLGLTKLNLLCYEVSQNLRNNKYAEDDLLFLLSLCSDIWFVVLGKLPRQYKDFQVAKEDY
jgi:hypothetical protein